jgi:hypothetical protein
VAGIAIFFALQSVSRADQYASIASFFLALAGAAAAVVARIRRKPDPAPTAGTGPGAPSMPSTDTRIAYDNGVVLMGDGSTANVEGWVESPRKKRRRH